VPPAPLIAELLLEAACQQLQRVGAHRSARRKLGILLQVMA
jgi:hypothetical protein